MSAIEQARTAIIAASLGSCDCDTKSPEVVFHAGYCRYTKLMFALDCLDGADTQKSDHAQYLDPPNILSVIDPFTRGAFTGWEGKTGESKITLDQAEDHFSLCMADMMDAVRAALVQGPDTSTDRASK